MSDLKQRISELAALMEEFLLTEAELAADGERIAFRRQSAPSATPQLPGTGHQEFEHVFVPEPEAVPVAPTGTPITSPMTGIFYISPSPNAPPFVKEGEQVSAGQVVGLIEAMKVFNEIIATTSGTVLRIAAEGGQLVQPGDPLLYVG